MMATSLFAGCTREYLKNGHSIHKTKIVTQIKCDDITDKRSDMSESDMIGKMNFVALIYEYIYIG